MNLKIVRLITGDEIIGDVSIYDDATQSVTIDKPLILGMIPKESQIIFLDLLIYSDEKVITVKDKDLIFMVEPKETMKEKWDSFWNQQNEIILPEENKIIS